ncbi:enamine deaminase RidA (YjgF/YER057c/UK114 family) [Hasllibacter halocynthiae]|uniref:Enamine deaminase RidA (YjgF/YER057c/UK114 family) n=1 Tax=Hasllibacter halocynthiae TaxID=595589 RepID=A0A2T0X996_9RHOB|nr:RidA family protein [Hasllibacter halocynthiae]PRY95522.1 enamine deaminase RidA (YjgF/YER057c/UK114 family) [Hasllibacter halocynthiae]
MNHGVLEPDGRRLHVTGQVAWDEEGRVLHSGDAGAQTAYAMGLIERIVAAAGGTLADLVSITTYYVDQDDYAAITEARRIALDGTTGPATTGIRVAGLVHPDLLVEIAAIAVIPERGES